MFNHYASGLEKVKTLSCILQDQSIRKYRKMKTYKEILNEKKGSLDKIQEYYYSIDNIENLRDELKNADDEMLQKLEDMGIDVDKEITIFTNMAKEMNKSKIGSKL